jgi:hypothetical protein
MKYRGSTPALTKVNPTDIRDFERGAYGQLLTTSLEDALNIRLRKWYDLFAVVARCVSRTYY